MAGGGGWDDLDICAVCVGYVEDILTYLLTFVGVFFLSIVIYFVYGCVVCVWR